MYIRTRPFRSLATKILFIIFQTVFAYIFDMILNSPINFYYNHDYLMAAHGV